jgi:signal transduction histidine kinase
MAGMMATRSETLRVATDRVRHAEAVRVDLLEYNRLAHLARATHDAGLEKRRADIAAKLFGAFDALQHLALPSEKPAVDKAGSDVRAYFAARDQAEARNLAPVALMVTLTGPIETALASLNDVARTVTERAQDEEASIQHLSRVSKEIGWVVAVLVVLGSVAILVVMYKVAVRPLIDLATRMKRFADGDRDVRAGLGPVAELATAAGNFNEMADVITGQHSRMLDFLGAVSRQLKSPVGVMRTSLAELPPNRPLPSGDKTQVRLSVVNRELDRLDGMVDGFLDASRVTWMRLDLQQKRNDICKVVKDSVGIYETFSSVHRLELTEPDESICVFGETGRLSQVFQTLLGNAIEYSPRGGVVQVSVEKTGAAEVKVSVVDYGIGIPQEDIGKIFEPFRTDHAGRAPSTTVALYVARRIVDAHGGRMEVKSKQGQGSTFSVYLPIAEPRKAEEQANEKAPPAAAARPEGVQHSQLAP